MGPLIFLAPAATALGAVLVRYAPAASRLIQPLQNMTQAAYARVEPLIGSAIAVTTATSATKGALHMGDELRQGDYQGAAITGAVTMVEMAGAKFVPVPLATGCALDAAEEVAAANGKEIFHANSAKTCEIVTHLPINLLPSITTAVAGEMESPSQTPAVIKADYVPSVPIAH